MEWAARIIETVSIGSGKKAIGGPYLKGGEVLNTLVRLR